VSLPRIIVRGATTMVTKRTNLRKAFLAPWHPDVKRIWLYALASAQQQYEVEIHTGSLPVNHEHLQVTPTKDNLPEFVRQVHVDVSCGVNALLKRERYDAPHELWDGRQPHYERLMDVSAQLVGSIYVQLNCVLSGLVARPEHMPGFNFDFDLWRQGPIEVPRPDIYFGAKRPECLQLEVTPPPLLYEAVDGDMDALVSTMQVLARERMYAHRALQVRGPMGAQRLQRLHPWSEPHSLREAAGARSRSFWYGTRHEERAERMKAGANEVHRFYCEYREVRLARRDGAIESAFPYGTYKERVVHGAPIQPEPPEGCAAVAMPGPTLREVKARVAAASSADSCERTTAAEHLETFRDLLSKGLQGDNDGGEHEVGEFRPDAKDRPLVIVRHVLTRREVAASGEAKRIVTHRDRRRGRPAKKRRPGADPPA